MLSDDITKGVTGTLNTAASVIGGGIRGAIMFGVLSLVAVSLAVALPAAFGAAGIGAGILAFLGALPAAAAGAGWAAAGVGALAGGSLMAVASIIPGTKEAFGFRRHPPLIPPQPSAAPSAREMALLRAQQRAASNSENIYYQDGLGAKLAQQGSAMQDQGLGK